MGWIQVPTRPGKPESRAQMDPLPSGPYVLVSQFEEIKGMAMDEALSKKVSRVVDTLPDQFWGQKAYAFENDRAVLVAYHYDTSD